MTISGDQGFQTAYILVFMDPVSHHNGYKLCNPGKKQIRMECFLILGLTSGDTETTYLESDLESAILSHIRDFLMEMGKGFAFVARQQHIVTETEDYYIDLVFYNIELKCYVLIDLKMGKITHHDVGQIDMYVRMYDELKCKAGENPTIGMLLCAKTDEDIARYSVLHDNDRLFMLKYLTYLPTKEQLKTEIERQKEIFYMQHSAPQENGGGTDE